MENRRTFLKATLFSLPFASFLSRNSFGAIRKDRARKPVIIATWNDGLKSNQSGWEVLRKGGTAIDAVEAAGVRAESEKSCCVGLGAYPDRDGKVTLDASIMNHKGDCGSVAFLQGIAHPTSVARKVMEDTPHVFLVGEGAKKFAVENGFEAVPEFLSPDAEINWKIWLKNNKYDPKINIENEPPVPARLSDGNFNHDTIGTIALDENGDLAGSCTTSGMAFKMHGRVGDSPIIGAGLFVDNNIGAVTSTGMGEEVIRTCGSHTVMEQMRLGKTPEEACYNAIMRVFEKGPERASKLQVGYIAVTKNGDFGAYALQKGFTYSVRSLGFEKVFKAKSHFSK